MCWGVCGGAETRTVIHCMWEWNGTATVEKFGALFLLNIHLPYDSVILLLSIYLREKKVCVHTKTCYTV